MSPKAKKPPIDKKSVRVRLERAQAELRLVRLRRWIPGSDRVDGFVVGLGRKWVLLAQLTDGVQLDGWALVRTKDIQAVVLDAADEGFTQQVLTAREQWPPTGPATPVDLDDTRSAVVTVATAQPLLTIHVEFDRPDVCWIGVPLSTDEERLTLREVGLRGRWLPEPNTYDLDDITRIEFGGKYEDALHIMAGDPPTE